MRGVGLLSGRIRPHLRSNPSAAEKFRLFPHWRASDAGAASHLLHHAVSFPCALARSVFRLYALGKKILSTLL